MYKLSAEIPPLTFPERVDSVNSQILSSFGILSIVKGSQYVFEAAKMIAKDMNGLQCLDDYVFPSIAQKYYTTSIRVKRAIRHAAEISWSLDNEKSLRNYFDSMPSMEELLLFLVKHLCFEPKDSINSDAH
ncbi:MAG: sporulation initiation factor Spo0A C-terminal domain-containing protein [Oscillospiraceae bacterium]|nr:sporulation initiation factor Spo0A C-terminal domain-containing protein [Oscillospiraceae bacterium]